MTSEADAATPDAPQSPERRDFLYIALGMAGVFGAAALAWPFIDQMEPSADVLAAAGPIEVDISQVEPGSQITVRWRNQPVFVAHRTAAELKTLRAKGHDARLRDPDSKVHQQPPYAQNWHRSAQPEYLILVGICTHLGCIPLFKPDPGGSLGSSWPGGYFCPCHGSRYDLAGRVFKNVPAPYNLPVPPYHFVKGKNKVLRVGENPPGANFNFGSIVQI